MPSRCQMRHSARLRYTFHLCIGSGMSMYSEKSGPSTQAYGLSQSAARLGFAQHLSNW